MNEGGKSLPREVWGAVESKSWDAYFSGTQLPCEVGGVIPILLTKKPRPERQGNWPKVTQHEGQCGRRRRQVDALSHREGCRNPWSVGGVKRRKQMTEA